MRCAQRDETSMTRALGQMFRHFDDAPGRSRIERNATMTLRFESSRAVKGETSYCSGQIRPLKAIQI